MKGGTHHTRCGATCMRYETRTHECEVYTRCSRRKEVRSAVRTRAVRYAASGAARDALLARVSLVCTHGARQSTAAAAAAAAAAPLVMVHATLEVAAVWCVMRRRAYTTNASRDIRVPTGTLPLFLHSRMLLTDGSPCAFTP